MYVEILVSGRCRTSVWRMRLVSRSTITTSSIKALYHLLSNAPSATRWTPSVFCVIRLPLSFTVQPIPTSYFLRTRSNTLC
ncbi:hypothetical protein Y032_0023g863 [Ancylostoma ceylanicum]|uniref:Uncharacterized protein n=1 Tax=Ancylostoma ceylanicum TaxID=53326 RepID=A0A016UYL6_9BILA|nr:hypothetical protein Y032_0023g863 [Ancylostoma ceylanicum]